MVDALAVVRLIVSVVFAIKEAVGSVKQNKEDCQAIAERVCTLDTDLSSLDNTEVTMHHALSSALEGLHLALHQALQVVMDCQDKSAVSRHANAPRMSEKLRKANQSISDQITRVTMVASLSIVLNTQHSQHALRPQPQEGISYLVNSREEEGTSHILSRSEKLYLSELRVATKNFSDENVISESASYTVYKPDFEAAYASAHTEYKAAYHEWVLRSEAYTSYQELFDAAMMTFMTTGGQGDPIGERPPRPGPPPLFPSKDEFALTYYSSTPAFIDKFRYNAKRASLVQSRIKALERMEHVDAVVSDPDYKFEFPTPEDRPGSPIISFSDASFGYPGGPILFKNLNFGIDLDSRIAMVGSNGIGKSTILKLISGDLQPTSGTVFRSPKVRMAVFSQHHVDGLDLTVNPLLYMMRCFPGVPEQKLRSHLGSFGVTGNLALQSMYTLSGGQKSRVAFAKITFKKPHIILLDEPSNHLDLDAVEALIQGLLIFQGGVLMVSHDEHLITGSVDELWAVTDGKVDPFEGTFKEYKKMLTT